MNPGVMLFALAAAFLPVDAVWRASHIGAGSALKELLEGNGSFLANRLTIEESSTPERRRALATGQYPDAVILSCSDSRVPPEIIFNMGPGQIFVVRNAGNICDPIVIGSIEFAIENLGSSLIVVLGHSGCGAVTAALDATGDEGENIGAIIKKIAPAVQLARETIKGTNKSELLEAAIDFNIRLSAQSLLKESPVIRSLADAGKVTVVCAKYYLESGKVKLL